MNTKPLTYDVVIIGAGNGGLVAATTCAYHGMKTLLIEQHNIPGGFASSFNRGRFEFDVSLHELGNLGNENNQGNVYSIFKELGIDVNWIEIPEAFNIIYENQEYILPFNKKDFIDKCDEYVPGSKKQVEEFLIICENCYDAIQYIIKNRGVVDTKIMKQKFANYLNVLSYTLDEVLTKMKMPPLIKFIIESYWIYLGLTPDEIACAIYAVMFYEYINFKAYIPRDRSFEISQTIANRFQALGGNIWFNTLAEEIIVEDNHVVGLKTSRGIIQTNYIIANVSPHIVYGNLIKPSLVPDINKQLTNARKPGRQGLCVYLGLNKSVEALNLKHYSYFVFNDTNHDCLNQHLSSIDDNMNYVVVALNVANPHASEKNTSILTFTTLYNDAWNNVSEEMYFKLKTIIAKRFIEDFEKRMHVKIKDYIEEIEVATPVTFARYTNTINGAIYGYGNYVNDSSYIRGKNLECYETINGLTFCGANGFQCHGYSITYVSGNIAGMKTYGSWKTSKVNNHE